MDVAAHKSFGRFARGFLSRSCLSLLTQNGDRLLFVTGRFHECRATIRESRVRQIPQLFYELGWNFHGCIWCTHPFSLWLSFCFLCEFAEILSNCYKSGPPRVHRGGPEKSLLPALAQRDSPSGGTVASAASALNSSAPSTKSPSCFSYCSYALVSTYSTPSTTAWSAAAFASPTCDCA